MAIKKASKRSAEQVDRPSAISDDFTSDLIKAINKEHGQRVAFNLNEDEAPTIIKRWISTDSIMLDYAIANKRNGGLPEGRIIELSGLPSNGKSHIAYQLARVTQKMGGLVVLIDTENATPLDKLKHMGIDVGQRFVYCDTHCTEEVFSIIESVIVKAKAVLDKNIPILVIWDSIAATSPKAELEGDYDSQTMGLQARVISKGMRKITGVIGQNNVTLLCLNQLRESIGVMHGDPYVTPGGKAVPFHASVRIRLTSGTQIKDKAGNVVGIHVIATIKKNKVAAPYKKVEFDIHFGKGIVEHEYLFDEVRSWCDANGAAKCNGKDVMVSGTGAWKELLVTDSVSGEVVLQKSFHKSDFGDMIKDQTYRDYLLDAIDAALTTNLSGESVPQSDDDEVTSDE